MKKLLDRKPFIGLSKVKFDLKMKLTALLLVVSFFQIQANDMYGQKTKVTLDLENVTIEKVLNKIEQITEFKFMYNDKDVDYTKIVTVKARKKSINNILKDLFTNTNVAFEVFNKQIILKKETPISPPVIVPEKEEEQQQINGTVTDSQGVPLGGVNILVKNTTRGTQTDFDGNYTIEANNGDVLVFSFLGMETQEVTVENSTTINITLQDDVAALEEVVVVGFGVQKKANLTGAVQSVDLEEVISDRPVTNAAVALQGTIPGLNITSGSGQPGAERTSINLRGFSSINGGEPLILVDNVPVSLNDINPQDIKEVTVLKDASATSIYGARAAFGVILITTKRPEKGGKVAFEYTGTTSFSSPTQLLEKASPLEFVTALNDWGRNPYWALGEDIPTWLDYLQQYQQNPGNFPGGVVEDAGILYRLKENDMIGDFYDDSGLTTIHNFNFGQATEKTSYRVSLGYSNEDGIIVTNADKFERWNVNAFLNTKLTDNLTAEGSLYYRNSTRTDPQASYVRIVGFPSFYRTGFFENTDGTLTPYDTPKNIVSIEPPNEIRDEVTRFFGKLIYEPITDLKVNGEFTFQTSNSETLAVETDPLYRRVDRETTTGGLAQNTWYSNTQGRSRYKATNIYANYNKTINEDHNFTLLGGFNYEEQDGQSINVFARNLINPDIPSISGSLDPVSASDRGRIYEWAVVGYYGRLNYNYKSKYFLELNGRYDGSSRFLVKDNFGFFPSASVGWTVSKESFMENIDFISQLKLRASWGEVGNQTVLFPGGGQDYYPSFSTLTPTPIGYINPNTLLNAVSLTAPRLISPGFTWETVRSLNFGLDLNLFNNRFEANLDIFKRETLDMITSGPQLPAVIGAVPPTANAADLETKGFDLNLVWKDNIGEDFSYTIGVNLHDNQTKITKFPGNEAKELGERYVGQTIGEIWGYVTDGYYTEDDFEAGSLNANLTGGTLLDGVTTIRGNNPNPGDIKFLDLDGDGEIFTGDNTVDNPGDRKIIGNGNRRYQYGVNISASYKNFDIAIFGNGIGKRDVWLGHDAFWPFIGQFDNIFKHQLDYWTPDNRNAYYPRNYSFDGSNYNRFSRRIQTKYLQNGAYFTIKNITLGYNFTQEVLDKLSLTKLRVYASGENLFLFDHLPEGLHPEFSNLSNGASYPFQRKFALGINIGF
jgi:TonB-linked SusC/RagA family outer membrane protein